MDSSPDHFDKTILLNTGSEVTDAAWMYPPQYIQALYKFAGDNGALVCFDEVQAGFYRMGEMYGYMTYGDNIKPDLICLGKGISSSLPMAALLGTADIIDVDLGANLSGTHNTHHHR